MHRKRAIEIPQWGSDSDWDEANGAIKYLMDRHRDRLGEVFKKAEAIKANLESLFPLLDDLCKNTCVACPSTCCLTATVWLDYCDLIFLHANGLHVPPNQLIEKQPDSCRFNSSHGCTLPRLSRPWVCTLYLCPPQMALLREKGNDIRDAFHRKTKIIKADRKILEKLFINICG